MPYRRPKRLRAKPRPTLHIAEILAWADDHKKRTGTFPTRKSGTVDADPKESWSGIDRALRRGFRGLPGRWSLPQLLAERRGYQREIKAAFLAESAAWNYMNGMANATTWPSCSRKDRRRSQIKNPD